MPNNTDQDFGFGTGHSDSLWSYGPTSQIPSLSDINSLIPAGGVSGYTPLNLQFPNDPSLQRSSDLFSSAINSSGANPSPQAFALGQSLFDLFSLSRKAKPDDYIGNILNQTYGQSYKLGGNVNSYKDGGITELVPIQTEKYKKMKEQIVTSDYEIFDVKANKSHDKMKDSDITDLAEEGSYIGSARPTYSITKKQAEDISLGFHDIEYKEDRAGELPKEDFLSDIFTKKSHTSAELFKNIKKRFPTLERDNDPLTEAANNANKESRAPYVDTVIKLIEDKKPISKKSQNIQEKQMGGFLNSDLALTGILSMGMDQMFKNLTPKKPEEDYIFKGGGRVSDRKPKKYPIPATVAVPAVASLLSSAIGFIGNNNARKASQRLTDQSLEDIALAEKKGTQNLGLGSASALMGILGQDTTQERLDLSLSQALGNQAFNTAISQNKRAQDYNANAAQSGFSNVARNQFNNTSSFAQGVSAANSLFPSLLRSQSQSNLNFANQNANLLTQQGQFNSGIADRLSVDNQIQTQQETNNRNSQIAQVGDVGTNYANNTNSLLMNSLNARLAARGQANAAQQQFASNNSNIANNALGSIATIGAQYFNNNTNNNNNSSNPAAINALFQDTTALPSSASSTQGQSLNNPVCPCLFNRDCLGNPC